MLQPCPFLPLRMYRVVRGKLENLLFYRIPDFENYSHLRMYFIRLINSCLSRKTRYIINVHWSESKIHNEGVNGGGGGGGVAFDG